MQAILISIKPKWVEKILNGEKTIEIRKTMPKCDLPIDVYIYCTKDNHQLVKPKDYDKHLLFTKGAVDYSHEHTLNGKVVAKFTLNKVDEHHVLPTERILPFNWHVEQKLKQLCLTKEEVMAYGNGEDYQAFLWHIDNLVIFDKPKELWEFCGTKKYFVGCGNVVDPTPRYAVLHKAPQNWCYVEV